MKPVALSRERRLVLVGTGPTHQRLLQLLARRRLPGLRVTLLAQPGPLSRRHRLPGIITGEAAPPDTAETLATLATRSGGRVLAHHATALDLPGHTLLLDNGDQLAYDLLSLDPELVQDRTALDAAMPGAREHGLFVFPMETFAALWPRVVNLPSDRLHSMVIVGAGTLALELAFALRQCMPQCAISVVSGADRFLCDEPARLQAAVRLALQRATINLLEDTVVAIRSGCVRLGCGAELACDVPLIAEEPCWPSWWMRSRLALNAAGTDVLADATLRASGQDHVFIAPRDAAAAVAGSLYANISCIILGKPPRRVDTVRPALRFAPLGGQRAVATWRSWAIQGHWVWRLKRWLERRIDAPGA